MASRPVIGLCTALERARWGVWDSPAHLLPREYADVVQRAGGIALLLPPDPRAIEHPDELLDLLDGLILAGGSDIDPATYGAERHPMTIGINPERDAFELALAQRAIERDLPFLGICRGMQVLSVVRGGSLVQHLPDVVGSDAHVPAPGTYGDNAVSIVPGSRLAGLVGTEATWACHHHQAVDRLAPGLVATAWAADGTVEALEDPARPFVVGVQWHPEQDAADTRLVAALVAAAIRRGRRRSG